MRSSTHSYAAVAGAFGRRGESGLGRIERAVESARASGAAMAVLPECALGGYLRPDGSHATPIGLDGPEIARLCAVAADMVVCAGFTERGGGRPYSSAVCVNGDGVLGHQRKVHLPPSECEAFAPGDGFAAFDTPVGRVGRGCPRPRRTLNGGPSCLVRFHWKRAGCSKSTRNRRNRHEEGTRAEGRHDRRGA